MSDSISPMQVVSLPFSAPLRDGLHWYVEHAGETLAGPYNTRNDAQAKARSIIETASVYGSEDWGRAAVIDLARVGLSDPANGITLAIFDDDAQGTSPGRFDGCSDRPLAVALDIITSHGAADAQAGETEFGLYLARVGRFVLSADDRGFIDCATYADADAAQAILDAEDARQYAGEEEN